MPVDRPSRSIASKAGLGPAFFVFTVLWIGQAMAQGRPYASIEHMFGGLVEYDRKIVQAEGPPIANDMPAGTLCLVAAVRLKPSASAAPPRRDLSRKDFLQFGGTWRETPKPAGAPRGKDVLELCGHFLRGEDFLSDVRHALETGGSHVSVDLTGDRLQLYSLPGRFALSLRLVQRAH